MDTKKAFISEKLKTKKFTISMGLIFVWAVSFMIRLTPLIRIYVLNFVTALVVKNTVSIFIISTILSALYIVEKKQFILKMEHLDSDIQETLEEGELDA